MIIQAELKCKQTGCEADPCAVDKVIELPTPPSSAPHRRADTRW